MRGQRPVRPLRCDHRQMEGLADYCETVPNRWAAAVFVDGPLDLIG